MSTLGAAAQHRCASRRVPASVLTLMAAAVGALVTLLILTTPLLLFGYREPAAHLVVDTVDACVAFLVAYLLYGRFVRSRRLQDLLLVQGLVLLAVAGLLLRVLMSLVTPQVAAPVEVWLAVAVRLAGALLIAAASLTPSRRVRRQGWQRWCLLPPVGYVVLVAVVLLALEPRLPVALDPAISPVSPARPAVIGHPALVGAQVVSLVCFLVAAVAFTAQAGRASDELSRWLGPACTLAAFARVNYVLFPSIYSDWLYVGDLLRVAFYLMLLAGAAREIRQYWSRQTQVAVVEDRRRLAHELHDGVLQELGYIRMETAGMAREAGVDPSRRQRLLSACDRAIEEARGAIDALVTTGEEPLSTILDRNLGHAAHRHGIALSLSLDPTVDGQADQRHALARIAGEALSNAARHGSARTVSVTLSQEPQGRCLVVQDDGTGFEVDAITRRARGHGLTSMRERARAIGGDLLVESAPGQGASVTVRW